MKERWYYFQFADSCFQEQPVLEEEPVFPSSDSLSLMSNRESTCEVSQERLLGSGQVRLLAGWTLNILEE